MNGGRLSAAEKGKQKAADLPHALVLESAGEPRPAGDAALPSPPPAPAPAPSGLPALNAEDAAAAGLAAVACLEDMVEKMQAALDRRLRVLEQLRRESEGGTTDRMLALRLQAEEMQAFKEFWKPVVPVPPQRNNSKRKINWKRIISLIAFTSGLVPYISFRTRLPVNNLFHILGTISVLWILRSTYSCHVPRLVYVCFWLLVLYVLYLVLRPTHGAFAGLLGKHQ